jgi:4-aminobutyrate aminotransferase
MSDASDDIKKLYDEYMITSCAPELEPIVVESARGATVVGADGRRYLDAFCGIAVVNAGHSHPRVVAAAQAQLEKLIHCGTYVYYNPLAARFAEKLASIAPGKLQKSFLANNGAEAIEGALRLAKQFTGRRELIALSQSFHGRTVGTLSISGNRGRKMRSGPYLSGVAFADAPDAYRCPAGTDNPTDCAVAAAESLERAIRYQTSGDVAAMIVEPVLGEGGIIVPPQPYFQLIQEICRREGILLIVDEVQTGFGRTGKMFAIEHFGVEPDLMTTAKGIAGGLPLAAFTTTKEIAAAFKPGDHLSTFGGNPVCCAAAIANVEAMQDERLPENAAERGKQILARLAPLREQTKLTGDVRGLGLMIGVELVRDEKKTPAAEEAKQVRSLCREAGVLVGVGGTLGNVVRIQPPLVITADEAEQISATVERAIQKVATEMA